VLKMFEYIYCLYYQYKPELQVVDSIFLLLLQFSSIQMVLNSFHQNFANLNNSLVGLGRIQDRMLSNILDSNSLCFWLMMILTPVIL